ncbi:hypothetical protein BV22DRAFT_1135361 [Leucogyrophana mollusca]|uniref:Uncharacterized protein n=1 Tax=Leucogyrophana mollusca TaxID=85980 RepID=A0ACB8AYI5_9AGAM|nr:hypothetical protein BV22DRAFT_1135361 [Leucogyrophana mollusca]
MPPDRTLPEAILNRLRERRRADLVSRILNSKTAVLEFDEINEDLRVWFWPINEQGERIAPSDLVAHRRSHQFLGPQCLCALTDDYTLGDTTEAAIVLLTRGPESGVYAARCARSKCGFLVFIEQMHTLIGVPIKYYPQRVRGEMIPLAIEFRNGEDINPNVLPRELQLTPGRLSNPFNKLMRLDSFLRPGLTEDEFRGLLTKCRRCRLIMTRSRFDMHECQGEVGDDDDVIDLTQSSDEN